MMVSSENQRFANSGLRVLRRRRAIYIIVAAQAATQPLGASGASILRLMVKELVRGCRRDRGGIYRRCRRSAVFEERSVQRRPSELEDDCGRDGRAGDCGGISLSGAGAKGREGRSAGGSALGVACSPQYDDFRGRPTPGSRRVLGLTFSCPGVQGVN